MSLMDAAEAADSLHVSPRRVRQMLEAGSLPGQRVGGSWVIERADVEQLCRRPVGRPWSAASAWAVLQLAAERDHGLSPVERSRARKRLADNGLGGLVAQLRARSERREMYAHPSALDRLGAESGAVYGGVSALDEYDVDLIAGEQAEVYVRASNVSDLVDRYALDAETERSNVVVRVVDDDDWPFEDDARVAPWSVVAVDLLDAHDERSRRAGLELIERHQ
jgi:excisionase family DNA binding protein